MQPRKRFSMQNTLAQHIPLAVIPAKAGIRVLVPSEWIPAFAGMTSKRLNTPAT
jgi:hypothetical protein